MSGAPSASLASPPDLHGHILFTRTIHGDMQDIFTASADGTNEQLVAKSDAGYCCPKWSPDGSRIQVTVERPEGPRGGTIAADGTDFRLLALPDPAFNLVPQAWSPDGERMAFEGWDDADPSRAGVYSAPVADAGNVTRLTTVEDAGIHDIPSDWSPDGKKIIVFRTAPEPDWDIGGTLWIVDADGQDAYPLDIADTVPSWWARWSPDGSKILFATARKQVNGALWTVNADGTGLEKVFEDAMGRFAIQPTWSPDGRHILFALNPIADAFVHPNNGLYVIDANGDNLTLLIGTRDFKSQPEWRA
jgi:Tol biopolymer transport system component